MLLNFDCFCTTKKYLALALNVKILNSSFRTNIFRNSEIYKFIYLILNRAFTFKFLLLIVKSNLKNTKLQLTDTSTIT